MAELTIRQAFDLALQHHQAGRLQEAEQLYRQILEQQSEHIDATHFLGVIAHQVGRNGIAVDLIRRAVTLRPNYPEAHSNLGNALKDTGQLDEAIAAYRQAIALRAEYVEAHNYLGVALGDKRRFEEAIAACRRAISLKPDYAEAFCNLGNVLRDNGQLDEAIGAYRQAIALKSGYAEAHSNLGVVWNEKGQLDEAIAAYRLAIALNPNYAQAHSNLGNALREKGQPDEAVAAYRQAIALKPNYAEAHSNLGNALRDKRQLDEAIVAYRQAIVLKPSFPEAHANLGDALRAKGQLDEAIAVYRQAISLKPNSAEVHNNFGNALRDKGRLDEAIAAYRQAIALKPSLPEAYSNLGVVLNDIGQLDEAIAAYRQAIALNANYSQAHSNLGNALKSNGQLDEAVAAYRRAIVLDPDNASLASNLCYVLHLHLGYDAAALAEEHHRWNCQHGEPLRSSGSLHCNSRSPDRRLRIGYVSPDFREHSESFFLVPLLSNHDRKDFEIFCYSSVIRPDAITQRIRDYADVWRDVLSLSDEELAEAIRDDGIDILVDLTMHMIHGRLLTFARKPAPVQVAWLAYPSTTGLAAMDYRLTDPYLDPPGLDDAFYSEKSVPLPDSFWCYDPRASDLSVNELPALAEGRVTFGCLNNFCKVNPGVLKLWAAVLMKVPDSRLLVLAPRGSHRDRALDEIARQGVAPSRVEFLDRRSRREYLQLYRRIDLCLDTFPYNGHTTSFDGMWMGVPMVTLVGKTAVGRGGLSIQSNLGLLELAARSEEEYVRIASELCDDLLRLSRLRSTLRQRIEQSPLMDAPRFARNVETAYREMWRKWCGAATTPV